MNALTRLQDKIRELKTQYETIKNQNEDLKNQLAEVASAQNEKQHLLSKLELEAQRCQTLEDAIEELKQELAQKDAEIEKIIAQVEALLA
jgi:chromosome segregation ATPase